MIYVLLFDSTKELQNGTADEWTFHNQFPSQKSGLVRSKAGQNIMKAQCHAVGTTAMNASAGSVHENVVGYDPSHLEQYLQHEIDQAVNLDWFACQSLFPCKYFWGGNTWITQLPNASVAVKFARAYQAAKAHSSASWITNFPAEGIPVDVGTVKRASGMQNLDTNYYAFFFGSGLSGWKRINLNLV